MRVNRKYIEKHPYCIENQAIKEFGETEIFAFAGYILPDGRMLNFSYGGYQRDEDHRIIGQFFRKRQGTEAMLEMMRRGSVRVMCNTSNSWKAHYCFDFIGDLTPEQETTIIAAYKEAYSSASEFYLEISGRNGKRIQGFSDWFDYLIWKEKIAA